MRLELISTEVPVGIFIIADLKFVFNFLHARNKIFLVIGFFILRLAYNDLQNYEGLSLLHFLKEVLFFASFFLQIIELHRFYRTSMSPLQVLDRMDVELQIRRISDS